MAMKNPPHPGEVVRDAIETGLGLTVTAAAKGLGVLRKHFERNGNPPREGNREFCGRVAANADSPRSGPRSTIGETDQSEETRKSELIRFAIRLIWRADDVYGANRSGGEHAGSSRYTPASGCVARRRVRASPAARCTWAAL